MSHKEIANLPEIILKNVRERGEYREEICYVLQHFPTFPELTEWCEKNSIQWKYAFPGDALWFTPGP
jgi:hypothetical protein